MIRGIKESIQNRIKIIGIIHRLRQEVRQLRQQMEDLRSYAKKRIKQLEEKNRELEKLSQTDLLTGLLNRRGMNEHFRMIQSHLKRRSHENPDEAIAMSLIRFDLDNFKPVNDLYGHGAGDKVLQAFAECLNNVFRRGSDLLVHAGLVRDGGDEFIAILPETSPHQAQALCEKFRHCLRQDSRFFVEGMHVTASIGVARINYEEEGALDRAIKEADKGTLEAKKHGKNAVRLTAEN